MRFALVQGSAIANPQLLDGQHADEDLAVTLSLNFRESAYAQRSENFPIVLFTFDHDDFTSPIRFSTDPTERLIDDGSKIVYGTTSNSVEYYFFPCTVKLPSDTVQGPGQMLMTFANVTRDYVAVIRAISGLISVDAKIVISNDLDTVETQWPQFNVTSIPYDAATIQLVMNMEMLINEPYPYLTYSPNLFPGLFQSV